MYSAREEEKDIIGSWQEKNEAFSSSDHLLYDFLTGEESLLFFQR